MYKIYPDKILKKFANLQFALNLLFIISIVIALGTIIPQDQDISFYQTNYPAILPLFGFVSWKFILFFNFDHIYSSYWFFLLLIVFGASLLSCTLTVQFPVLRRLRRWQFSKKEDKISNNEKFLPSSRINSLNYNLHLCDYIIFRQGRKNYAYSGLLGRFGPIVVHASIILLLLGTIIGNLGGYIAQEFVPRGEIFHSQNLTKVGSISVLPQNLSWRVNDFWIKYNDKLTTSQYYSDLSLLDSSGNEITRKTVFVNEPLVYKGITIYQTDWDIVGLKYAINGKSTQQLFLKKIKKFNQNFWFGSVTVNTLLGDSKTLSLLCKDLSGNIYLYDNNGKLINEFKQGQILTLDSNTNIQIKEILTNTGLQIKTDPGIKTIYFSFFLLMLSTYTSFISYSQIWGLEKDKLIEITGNSNRAKLFFQSQFKNLIMKIPSET